MTRQIPSPDFDPRIADWLESDPDDAPDLVLETILAAFSSIPQRRASRVPWRSFPMNRLALLGAAAAVVVVIGAALVLFRPPTAVVGGPSPSPFLASPSGLSASTPPSASVAGLGLLDASWVSHRHGYSIGYPGTWTATPASADWRQGKRTLWGDPALDTLAGTDARFVAASQPLAGGKSADDWYTDYCVINGGSSLDCGSATSRWQPIQIGGVSGYLDSDGEHSPPNGIAADGIVFDAVVVSGGRGYEFTLDGNVDRKSFDRMMSSVELSAGDAARVAHLTATFTSAIYAYSLPRDPSWTTKSATVFSDDSKSTEQNSLDAISPTDTDTTINGSATALHGKTYEAWAVDHHNDVLRDVPSGCDGGDPSTWPIINVGGHEGHLDQLCNAAEVSVPAGDWVYLFFWGNSTFSGSKHFGQAQFLRLLEDATLSPSGPQPVG
jgi:hypothetical protein